MTDSQATVGARSNQPRPGGQRYTMNDGHTIPALGFGTYKIDPAETERCVVDALHVGYRHIDTAALYENEEGVGSALRYGHEEHGLHRENVFVTSKVWNTDQGRDRTLAAFDASMEKLGLEYLDLYLIHWAMPKHGRYVDTWKALIELQESGRVRSIGVSNFPKAQLEEIVAETGVKPAVNQIELHPYWPQRDLRQYCREQNILVESWAPLGRGVELDDPVIKEIARRKNATPAQVILAWHRQRNLIALPKTTSRERMQENWGSLAVRLGDEDRAAIAKLAKEDGRIGPDPETMMPA